LLKQADLQLQRRQRRVQLVRRNGHEGALRLEGCRQARGPAVDVYAGALTARAGSTTMQHSGSRDGATIR